MEVSDLFSDTLMALEKSWQSLPDKPEESPISTLRALWFLAAGEPRSVTWACKNELPPLSPQQCGALVQFVKTRIAGMPLAYITGRQEFMGIEFISNPSAMIPRKETEILGRAAREAVKQAAMERGRIKVLDLCTGSGNLALFLAKEVPESRVVGIDISAEAIALARQNAEFLDLGDRVDFISGDLFQPLGEIPQMQKFDVIVCNPPYISSAHVKEMPAEIMEYEPELAFNGGPFGLNIPRRLINEAPSFLKDDSWLCFEVGLGQGNGMFHLIQKMPVFQKVLSHNDTKGEIRAITARVAHQENANRSITPGGGNNDN